MATIGAARYAGSEELARRPGDFAVAGAAVAADGGIARASISLLGLGPTPLRAVSAETLAVASGQAPVSVSAEAIGRAAVADLDSVSSDLHGTAGYRKKVGAAMVARAWEKAVKEAADG